MFPLKKNFVFDNNTVNKILNDYAIYTEIPSAPHPGAFGVKRKNHIHEGIDLYCEESDKVYSMMDGKIIRIDAFTGVHAGSPWWNDTWYVLIEHNDFTINYGEIIPDKSLFVGKEVKEGDIIGEVKMVLKKDKGRPKSMLHLEMYEKGTKEPIKEWALGEEKPHQLLDPTNYLQQYLSN